jgi:pimeloyl-ACP methyl ester carboxylesterase
MSVASQKDLSSPAPSDDSSRHLAPPSYALLALEFRAFWEFSALLPAWPLLQTAPKGDGHTVIVFPGLSANDTTTVPLRRYLSGLGYVTQGWSQGFNFGPRSGVLEAAKASVRQAFEGSARKVSLVGWSLGGVYARELAKEMPDMVRCVVTLGTPFAGSHKSTNAWRLYELASGRKIDVEASNYQLEAAPPVPTTSIYSRTDGIVAWQGSVQAPSADQPQTENIEVIASHFGIGLNPSAWWAVADRLHQQEGHWTPFKRDDLPGIKGALTGFLTGAVFPDPQR